MWETISVYVAAFVFGGVLMVIARGIKAYCDSFQEKLSAEFEETRKEMRLEIRIAINKAEYELKRIYENTKN
ncbi:hypothetical protein N9J61_02955 [Pelagibacterales bacterium]|nr:hypothetical protein [Pelagibacterales bacterium]